MCFRMLSYIASLTFDDKSQNALNTFGCCCWGGRDDFHIDNSKNKVLWEIYVTFDFESGKRGGDCV